MSFLEPWILLGMVAGVFQALRVAGQRALAQRTQADIQLSVWSAALARCLFGLPWALLILLVLIGVWGPPVGLSSDFSHNFPFTGEAVTLPFDPETGSEGDLAEGFGTGSGPDQLLQGPRLLGLPVMFWLWTLGSALLQIAATLQQTHLLSQRNFAIGVVYVKTEVVIVALIGSTPFFAQYLSGLQWTAVLISVVGVVVLTRARLPGGGSSVWDLRSAWLGLSGGALLAGTSLTLREAGLILLDEGAAVGQPVSPAVAGMTTLVALLVIQCLVVITVMTLRDASEFNRVARRLRPMAFTGLLSAFGSAGWFIGYVMAAPALVKSVGQVEFIAAIILTFLLFRERPSRAEWIGMSIILISILMLLFSTL